MKETAFSEDFIDHMKLKFPFMWEINLHGHEMQSNSIPDHVFCINSFFAAIEFKIQRDGWIKMAPAQMRQINKIKDSNGIGLVVAYNEYNDKILIREKRLDYKAIFFNNPTKSVRSTSIKIDWDFEFSRYEDAIDLIWWMVENK